MDKETIENKFQSLPSDVKAAITSPEIAQKIQDIAKNHQLHIDQSGLLEEEISFVMLGIRHPDEFVNRIEERLNLTTEDAISLAVEVNEQIFLSIRESLEKMHGEDEEAGTETHETYSTSNESVGSKESLLAEIENPSPTIHPISAADQTIAGPATSREIISTPAPSAQTPIVPATNFMAQKLGAAVNTPTPKIADKVPIPSEKPKSYTADPYREPIA